jgi:ABC-type glycerol-3-phosphate transport system substrate-binding protein
MGNGVVRVYQEDWFAFLNLPAALARFEAKTGIKCELALEVVGVGTIENMFDEMVGSFTADQPAFDLICTDEVILHDMARQGRVVDLSPLMARDALSMDHVTEATRLAVTQGDTVLGLPCINTCSMLLYRRDLLEDYGLPVPGDWQELAAVAAELQQAVRRDGVDDFYGFETRGAAGGGHAVWTIGSFLGSFGARWLTLDGALASIGDAHFLAIKTYLDLIRTVCPPDQAVISFPEMRRDIKSGRVGMIMDVGMEYAHMLATDSKLADKVAVALVPGGPAGRAANLYTPPWAIPVGSDMKTEAWELAKYLTSDSQLLEDGIKSNAVETASLPVLYSSAFDSHFRADLLSCVRASRAIAHQQRPDSYRLGIAASEIVGDALSGAIVDQSTAEATVANVVSGLRGLLAGDG